MVTEIVAFAELGASSNFSFLRGGSHAEELVLQAVHLGLSGIAITDRNTLAGVVRGHTTARENNLPFAVGCRLAFRDGTPDILAWPTDKEAYGRLTRLLTRGNIRAVKGDCLLDRTDLLEFGTGMMLGMLPQTVNVEPPDPVPPGSRFARQEKQPSPLRGEGMHPGNTASPFSGGEMDRVRRYQTDPLTSTLATLREAFPGAVRLMASITYGASDHRRLAALAALARSVDVPLLATNDVLYHAPDRRPLQDVLTCIREHTTLATAGHLLAANAERHLKSPAEMARLFADYPEALRETLAVRERLAFKLDDLRYQYPEDPIVAGATPREALAKLAHEGARFRYPTGVPDSVLQKLDHEIEIIAGRQYEPYFLTVYDIVRFARSEGILCQGRGSAANSAVCYCLGITEVDPSHAKLLFERFISPNRNEPPDIDVDFEHERREIVMQYIFNKYTRDRAGIAATVITYRTRSAVRDVGKVFGLSEDTVGALASTTWGWSSEGVREADVRRAGLDPNDRTLTRALDLTKELIGFPRHLSQHVGGFVMTNDRLDESVPIMNAAMPDRTHVEWDKDDLDALGMMKVDVLALGMLTCIRRAFEFLALHYDRPLTLATIPKEEGEDSPVYRMLGRADSVGVFQVESRAQMSMLPRLKPATFYDLVIEVAIVRPGPIQGDMVHPYLRRRQGIEDVEYPSPSPEHGDKDELRSILERTLGVPLFQEQAMKIAMDAAKFSAAEADGLRRAMATFRRNGTIGGYRDLMIERMTSRGYTYDFAERCFHQIEGFGDYGFPESHAASFALLVYASSWLKCHYPDVFCAALLNSQPMGFYAPAQIVRDAERHGVVVLPPDINFSDWDSTLEEVSVPLPRGSATGEEPTRPVGRLHPAHADMAPDIWTRFSVRLGLRQIKGMGEADARTVMAKRGKGYDSVRDLWLRTGLGRAVIERLADGDTFRSVGLDRRAALWAARGIAGTRPADRLPLFDVAAHANLQNEPDFALPPMPLGEHVVNDYRYLSLSLKAHPLSFLRERLRERRIADHATLRATPNNRRLTVAGLVLIRQRPGTANGVIFMTLEDETDIANIIVWPKTFETFRPIVLGARLVAVTGKVQSQSGVIHVVADKLEDLTSLLAALSAEGGEIAPLARADEVRRNPGVDNRDKVRGLANHLMRHPRNEPVGRDLAAIAEAAHEVMPKGRNFH